ncbi:LacI family DNA-binding transcriptional regulator [Intrasporangium sp.]|uniref:LacI family DNA-binding transcriptional regulator n=1 Tax=Intrasporangium sp. TaxID=1925024 RepID=UPI00336593BE
MKTPVPGPARPITMADVAARAGVSTATVSRVLSDSRPVAPSLREAVLDAASALGYQVNLLGRALRKGRTATVGLLVPDLDNPFFSSLAQHLSTAFEGSATDVLIFSAGEDLAVERRGVESFLGRQVDAIVIIPCDEIGSTDAVLAAAQGTATIQLDRQVVGAGIHFVGCDNEVGMALVAQHVKQHVSMPDQPVIYVGAQAQSSSGHERYQYFNTHFPEQPTFLGEFDVAWGQSAVDLILEQGFTRATIVTAADIIALGVISGLHVRGYRVPDDFRVIGFDGIGVARLSHPTLTTVRQPVEEMGRTVLEIISSTSATPGPRTVRLAPEFVVGESSPHIGDTVGGAADPTRVRSDAEGQPHGRARGAGSSGGLSRSR